MPDARASIVAGDIQFILPVNPYSASWNYTENAVSQDTVGGRVVQLLSVSVDELTVASVAGSRVELQKAASIVEQIMRYHIRTQRPARFRVPSRKWDFNVFVTAMPQVGWDVGATSYPYQLTMSVDEDLSGIKTAQIQKKALGRLAEGIGYNPGVHGGDAQAITQLVKTIAGISAATSTAVADPTVGTTRGADTGPLSVTNGGSGINPDKGQLDVTDLVKLAAWAFAQETRMSTGDIIKNSAIAAGVAICESGGHVTVTGAAVNGTAYGLWQAPANNNGISTKDLLTAEGNARWMARELEIDFNCSGCSHGSFGIRTWEGAWYSYWSTFRSGCYKQYLTQARNAARNLVVQR